jgi:predicted peptidase
MKPRPHWPLWLLVAGLSTVLFGRSPSAAASAEKPLRASEPSAPAQVSTNVIVGRAGYKFLAFLPRGLGRPAERRPLILFLHGACPDESLEKFKYFGPISYALRHDDFAFAVVCPASSRVWSLPALDQLLRQVEQQFQVDPERIYVTGYSNGGHATWMLALAYPRRFAAIAPVAGAGNPQDASRRLHHLPVWIFHGTRDEVVPAAYGRMMAEALLKAGAEVKTTFYEDRGHDTWGPPYANAELYEWFLRHRRTGVARGSVSADPITGGEEKAAPRAGGSGR